MAVELLAAAADVHWGVEVVMMVFGGRDIFYHVTYIVLYAYMGQFLLSLL